jgi:hypothetical protein
MRSKEQREAESHRMANPIEHILRELLRESHTGTKHTVSLFDLYNAMTELRTLNENQGEKNHGY